MVEELFEVAAEFQFGVGEAIVNTKALQNQVDSLHQSVDNTIGSMKLLGGGLIAHLGLGSGSMLSVFSKAFSVSQEFEMQSLQLAGTIGENFKLLSDGTDTFNNKLATSNKIMNDIGNTANKFGVDSTKLGAITNMLATPLAQRGKLGKDFSGAISLGKNAMVAGEMTGLGADMIARSLYMGLTEHMSLPRQLFSRLANTPEFKQAHIVTQGQFVGMNQDRKMDLVVKAMERLGNDADYLVSRLQLVSTQFTILKNNLSSMLKPIGDALKVPLMKIFQSLNSYLAANGQQIGNSIGKFLGDLLANPKEFLIGLLQLKTLGHDIKFAAELAGGYQILMWVKNMLGITFSFGRIVSIFSTFAGWIGSFVSFLWSNIALIGRGLSFLIESFLSFMGPFLVFLAIIEVFRRAIAIAKVHDAQALITWMPKLLDLFGKLKDGVMMILTPVLLLIDWLANLIAPIFEFSFYLNIIYPVLLMLAAMLQTAGRGIIFFTAVIGGLWEVIKQKLLSLIGMGTDSGKKTMDIFGDATEDYLTQLMKKKVSDKAPNISQNIGRVEIRNEFKEQMEPDRVAFALKQQLMRVATNPTQARGNAFAGSFAGGVPFGVNQ